MKAAIFLVLLFLMSNVAVPTSPVHELSIPTLSELVQLSDDNQNVELFQTIQASVELIGSWSKTNLKVRIVSSGVSALDEAAFRGVLTWYDSITEFVSLYGYNYLSSLGYEFVENSNEADVTIEYASSLGGTICGLASLRQNFITREIYRVEIRISRSCVGGNPDIAYKVVAHEYGHALGIGHSSYEQDLMYERVNTAERPSTLNIYALAVAYSWVSERRFQPISVSSVSLPPQIPYAYIIPKAETHTIRIFTESELGLRLLNEYRLPRGTVFRFEFETEIDFGNATKEVFDSWSESGGRVSYLRSLQFVVSRDVDIVGRYDVYYYVSITGFGGETKGWFRKGSELYVKAEEIVDFGNDTRLVFQSWSDGNMAQSRRVVVDKPIAMKAVYGKQYRVYVESLFDLFEGDGWFFEGTSTKLLINKSVVEIGDGVRFRLNQIIYENKLFGLADEFEILVDGPVHIRTSWVVEYHVSVFSTHGVKVLFEGWMENGSMLSVEAPGEIVWENGTRAVFSRWSKVQKDSPSLNLVVDKPLTVKAEYKIFYFVEIGSAYPVNVKSGWFERGAEVFLDVGLRLRETNEGYRVKFAGWTGLDGGERLVVLQPTKVSAVWVEEVRITVSKPNDVTVLWVSPGSVVEFEAEPVIQLAGDRRLVFEGFDGDVDEALKNRIKIRADRPKTIIQRYFEEVLVSFVTLDSDGYYVPAEIFLRSEWGELAILPFNKTWLPASVHKIEKIVFNEVDVKKSDILFLSSPGDYRLDVNVYRVKVRVLDLLGVPLVGSFVKVERENGVLEAYGKVNIWGEVEFTSLTSKATKGTAEYFLYRHEFVLQPENGFVELRMGMPVQALFPIVLAISLIGLVAAKHKEQIEAPNGG